VHARVHRYCYSTPVSRNPSAQLNSRPRPVTEAPVEGLLDRADELAKRWAIALILARPIERLGELPLEDLALEAPALCAQVIRALLSDAELERIAGGEQADARGRSASARRLAALAGAEDAEAAVAAVEALRAVMWEALLEELADPPARQVADLADRLAYVCASALTATILATVPAQPTVVPANTDLALAGEPERASTMRGAVVVDERDEPQPPAGAAARRTSPSERDRRAQPLPGERPAQVRPFPWDLPPSESREASPAAGSGTGPEIEIRDERHEHGPAAWISSIGRSLEQFERDRLPFAVLLVELFDFERLGRGGDPSGIATLTRDLERVLAHEPRVRGSLTRERPGRYWLLAHDTDGLGVRALAERLVQALTPVARRRELGLAFAVGTAVCPEDGRDAATLAARADLALCDARPARRPVGLADRPAEGLDRSG
jgi:hypothetical protein